MFSHSPACSYYEKVVCYLCMLINMPSKNRSTILVSLLICVMQQTMRFESMCYSYSNNVCYITLKHIDIHTRKSVIIFLMICKAFLRIQFLFFFFCLFTNKKLITHTTNLLVYVSDLVIYPHLIIYSEHDLVLKFCFYLNVIICLLVSCSSSCHAHL